MAAGRPFCCEYRLVWPDGAVRWVEAQAKYETNSQGKAVRMLGVMTDITHRKQAEAVLLRTEKLAAAGRLAASIAHEINNPLEAVANLLYLIAQADDLNAARHQAQLALTEVMRVSRITQQTLKFHRQSELARRIRLSEVINDVLELFQGQLAGSNITIERRYEDDPEVECLIGDLRQVFANLVANALDAMNGGSGRLTIRIRQSHDWRTRRNPGMRITLRDTGCGMSLQTRRRIYEPFFTTKKESGTGLGLWVTTEIIERQHGDLHVWSSQVPGRSGTVFSLFLPLRDASLGVLPSNPHETILQAK
jgi:two-component system CheB/CheR fusion protein